MICLLLLQDLGKGDLNTPLTKLTVQNGENKSNGLRGNSNMIKNGQVGTDTNRWTDWLSGSVLAIA